MSDDRIVLSTNGREAVRFDRDGMLVKNHDAINSPDHYKSGAIECIDAIRAQLSEEEMRGYYRGNIAKYMWRYRNKNKVEDLMKAEVYLEWLMTLEREATP